MLSPHNTWHPHSTIKTRPSTSSAWSICKLVSFFITHLPKTYAIHALFFLIWTFAQWNFPLPPLTLDGTKTSFLTLTKNFKILPMQYLRNTLTNTGLHTKITGSTQIFEMGVPYSIDTLFCSEPSLQRSSHKKAFWKSFWQYVANLQDNTHLEVWFQWSYFATILKSHFRMGVFL